MAGLGPIRTARVRMSVRSPPGGNWKKNSVEEDNDEGIRARLFFPGEPAIILNYLVIHHDSPMSHVLDEVPVYDTLVPPIVLFVGPTQRQMDSSTNLLVEQDVLSEP